MTTSTTHELLGFAAKPATFARLVKNVSVKGNDKYVAKIYKDDDEYQVKFFVDGKHQKKADFFTPDLDDAQGTAEYCINDMIRKNMSRPAEFMNIALPNGEAPKYGDILFKANKAKKKVSDEVFSSAVKEYRALRARAKKIGKKGGAFLFTAAADYLYEQIDAYLARVNPSAHIQASRPAVFGSGGGSSRINKGLPNVIAAIEAQGIPVVSVSKHDHISDADIRLTKIGDTQLLMQIGDEYWSVQKAGYKDGRPSYIQDIKIGSSFKSMSSAIARLVSEQKKLLAANTAPAKKKKK